MNLQNENLVILVTRENKIFAANYNCNFKTMTNITRVKSLSCLVMRKVLRLITLKG